MRTWGTSTSGFGRLVVVALCAALLVGCGSSDDGPGSEPAPDDSPAAVGEGDPTNLCSYLSDADLAAINPRGKEPVSTILLGDFTYAGCTIGDVFNISFGVRVIDTDDDLDDLLLTDDAEPVEGFGDEALVDEQSSGDQVLSTQTVARFDDLIVFVRNDSLGYGAPDAQISDDQLREVVTRVAESLPDDFVSAALLAEVDEEFCPPVDSDVVTAVTGPVELARGGFADDAVRCSYRGEDGTQIRLSSRDSDEPIDYELAGDPISLPNVAGASGTIQDGGSSVELAIISPGERLSFIAVHAPDSDETVDRDLAVDLAEEFIELMMGDRGSR